MGSDDIFKKNKLQKSSRKHEIKPQGLGTILIVCEGEKTEPLYFLGLLNYICNECGGRFQIEGVGKQALALIEATEKIVNRANAPYTNVWVVFDYDDNKDFDNAIKKARAKGYNVAWSNQCFEYWLYLHFHYCDSIFDRPTLEEHLCDALYNDGGYAKNRKDLFEVVKNGLSKAIENAKRIRKLHGNKVPSKCKPCTTVYKLIEKYKKYLTLP